MNLRYKARQIRELLQRGWSQVSTARAVGVARELVAMVASEMEREKQLKAEPPPEPLEQQPDDPTPEEIAERAAEIRSRWGPEEETIRRTGPVP